jgi:DNA-binding beta-propeller fold protein YncE
VWVANGSEGTVTRIDPRTNAVVDTIDLSGADELAPVGAYSVVTGAGAVWVGSGSGALVKIDPVTDEFVDRVAVGRTPVDVAFGAGALWVVHIGGRLLRIDSDAGTVTVSLAAAPHARAVAAGEGGVWIGDARQNGGGLVWRIDPATVTVSGGPTKLARPPMGIATGGKAVWVAGGQSGAVTEIDPRSGNAVRSIRIGGAPLDVAYGDGALWVAVGARTAAAI